MKLRSYRKAFTLITTLKTGVCNLVNRLVGLKNEGIFRGKEQFFTLCRPYIKAFVCASTLIFLLSLPRFGFAQQGNLPCNALNSTPFIPPTITGTLSQTTSTNGVGAVYWENSSSCVLGLPLGCGSIHIADNVINSSTADYATARLAVGLGLSATMRVTEATNTYSASNFAGYMIDNASLLSDGLLNAITVKTYNNGTLAETSSAGSLIGIASTLVAGKYEIGFYTTLPFDAIEITFNSVAGLAISYDVYYPVVRKYCTGPSLVCNTKTGLNKNATPAQSFPVEIDYANTGISGIALATITSPESAISQSTSDFASVVFPVGIGSANLAVKDHFTTYVAGHLAGFDIENVTALGAGLFNSTIITTYLNGVQRETASGNSLAISAGLLSSSGRQVVGFMTTMSFDEIKITLNQNGLSLGTTKIYNAVCQKFCAATLACNQTYSLSSPDYPVVIDGGLTGVTGVACVGCSVSDADNALSSSTTDYATITLVAGLASSGAIAVQDAIYTYPAGTAAGFTIKDVNNLSQVGIFGAITVSTYNNGVFQESKTAGDLQNFGFLTNWVGLGSGAYNIGFTATLPFDEVRLSVGSLVSGLNIIQVYGAYVNTTTSYGGTLLCAATFNFNCGTASVTGIFEASGLGGQTGSLTLPITGATAGSTFFSVTGAGFKGTLTTALTVGQTSVTIPLTFDGSGSAGTRTLTVSSASGTGTCTPSVSVTTLGGGCLLSLPSLPILGGVVSMPNFCLKGNYNYYKALSNSVQEMLAINPNGNVFNPTNISMDATSTGVHSITSGSNTTALVQRMVSIQASGSFTVNGGIKVRIYYNPLEFTTLPTDLRRWFKHTAHTKAGVLADLTATGLANATFLTPDSTGIENGLTFVEFFNINTFSTFGYLGMTCTNPIVNLAATTAPSVSSCPSLNDGTITVTATGSNLQYSKDNGTTWQASNTFTGLTASSYTIKIRDSVTNCEGIYLLNPVILTAPTCLAPCLIPSVGGLVTYAGGILCDASNIGTASLTGQIGSIVRWETSTNLGVTWSPLVSTLNSYNFTNAANGQQYRAVINNSGTCLDAYSIPVTIATSSTVCTSAICDNTTGNPSFTVSQPSIATYDSKIIMTNASGVIQYASAPNGTTINGVAVGDYLIYRVIYDPTALPLPVLTVGTNITGIDGGGGCTKITNQLTYKVCTGGSVLVNAKVFLSGNYEELAGLMHDSLRVKGLIPTTQPYASMGYDGIETTTSTVLAITGVNAIVDWVLVELRSDTSTTVSKRAGLLQRNGHIVDVDGISSLSFTAPAGNYYVVVKHRNHLGVMSANALALSGTTRLVDFTSFLTTTYQRGTAFGNPYARRSFGLVRALWSGNTGGGVTIKATGANSDSEAVLFKVLLDSGNINLTPSFILNNMYLKEDANMDGKIIYQGTESEIDNILFNVLLHAFNTIVLPTYVIYEQIP